MEGTEGFMSEAHLHVQLHACVGELTHALRFCDAGHLKRWWEMVHVDA